MSDPGEPYGKKSHHSADLSERVILTLCAQAGRTAGTWLKSSTIMANSPSMIRRIMLILWLLWLLVCSKMALLGCNANVS